MVGFLDIQEGCRPERHPDGYVAVEISQIQFGDIEGHYDVSGTDAIMVR